MQPLLEESLTLRDAPPAVHLEELDKRRRLRTVQEQLMAVHDLDALAYPTTCIEPTRIGEEQPEGNCHLSANSGLPAITVPGGFTARGLPVDLKLLGRARGDAELVGCA